MGHALCGALLLAALAQDPPADQQRPSFLLRIDGRDVFFDLGRSAGAAPGDRVRVLRTVRALHPLDGKPVEDSFIVGEIEIAEAGQVLARARPDAELSRLLRVGDRVELARAAPDPRLPRAAPSAVACPAGPPSPDAQDALGFRQAWLAAQPLPPQQRAHHFRSWLLQHPSSALAAPMQREIAALENEPREKRAPPAPTAAKVIAPSAGFQGNPVEVVLALPAGEPPPRAATLNWRPRGEPLFRPVAFAPDLGGTLRARLPASAAQPPGLDYYVDVVGPSGGERALGHDGAHPDFIDIQRPPGFDATVRRDRSRAGIWIDYVDWNHFKGNDQHLNVEGEFLYRVLSPVHSIRLGFGVYQGRGEPLSQAIEDERRGADYRSIRVGYNYGFTELEVHPADWLGLMGKLLSGVNRDGFLMGFAGSVRIGREEGTSLTLGSAFTPGIGNRNEISLAWDAVRGWPMAASVIVSNEPVQAEYGVRFVYQVGRKLTDWYDVSLRASYQLRDIQHNGFGLGLAQSFYW